jgi:hypothetical protein
MWKRGPLAPHGLADPLTLLAVPGVNWCYPANICPLGLDVSIEVWRLADNSLFHDKTSECKANVGGPPVLHNQAGLPAEYDQFRPKKE